MREPTQRGQALVEALVVFAAVASLWLGVAWIGRLQDVALQLSHTSRHAAFAHAHQGLDESDLVAFATASWSHVASPWLTRSGDSFLVDTPSASPIDVGRLPVSWAESAPRRAPSLWRELRLGDAPLWRIGVQTMTRGERDLTNELRDFDRHVLSLRAHTTILRGTGAASDDLAVQQTLAASPSAWGDLASRAQRAGQRVHQALRGIDEGWRRDAPSWDWLMPWASRIPQAHLGREVP